MEPIDFTPALDKINSMTEGFIALIPNLIVALVVFGVFYVLALVARGIVLRLSHRSDLTPGAGKVLGRLVRTTVMLVGVLVALPVVFEEFTAAQVVEVLGIGGVAIGFAFRDVLQNFLAGLLILITQPFRIGDQIIFEGYEGTIEDIFTRATILKTYDGRQVVIPNAELFTKSVEVNTAYPFRRGQCDVGISYDADIEQARRVMVEAMQSVSGVLDDPAPDAMVVELGPSSVNIQARWWANSQRTDLVHTQGDVVSAIKERLLANGIDVPFPTRQVLLHDQTGGDRARQTG